MKSPSTWAIWHAVMRLGPRGEGCRRTLIRMIPPPASGIRNVPCWIARTYNGTPIPAGGVRPCAIAETRAR